MKAQTFALLMSCVSVLSACGSETPTSSSSTAAVTVPFKGTVQAFPFPKSETLPSFDSFQLRLFDANAVWKDVTGGQAPTATSVYDKVLTGMSSSCATSGCSFLIASQNIADIGPNMVALVNGGSSASQRFWAPVYTNVVDSNTLLYAQQHRGTLNATAPAYAISLYGLGQLATQLGIQDATTLLARGLVIGMVRAKDPTDYSGGLPQGVAGAQITLTQEQAASVTLYYPDAAYTTVTNGISTNSDGVFYLVGNSSGATLASTTLAIRATSSNFAWTNRPIAMIRGSVVVAPLQAVP